MKVLFSLICLATISHCKGGLILNNVQGIFGTAPHSSNSPIIYVNKYQNPPRTPQIYGEFQLTTSNNREHSRGDHGTLYDYERQQQQQHNYVNTNIKGGGLKYGYASPNSVKKETYHHRHAVPSTLEGVSTLARRGDEGVYFSDGVKP